MPALFLLTIRLARGVWSGLRDPEFRGLFTLVILLILSGAWFYHSREGWSWLDSIYFTVITLTTVGYGDFSPQTAAGKIFTMVYIILGLGIVSSFIVMVAERHTSGRTRVIERLTGGRATDHEDETGDLA